MIRSSLYLLYLTEQPLATGNTTDPSKLYSSLVYSQTCVLSVKDLFYFKVRYTERRSTSCILHSTISEETPFLRAIAICCPSNGKQIFFFFRQIYGENTTKGSYKSFDKGHGFWLLIAEL